MDDSLRGGDDGSGELAHRWRSVEQASGEVEVQSTWQLDSMAAYSDIRAASLSNPGWNAYVRDAMPLVKSGTRRFYGAGEVTAEQTC